MIQSTTVTRHEKVFTGYKPQQESYIPAEKVNRPLIANRQYVKIYGLGKNPVVSEVLREVRRRQLQQSVISCRKAIRNKALMYKRDQDTILKGITASQKTAIRAEKFMKNIVDCKHITV